MCVCSMGRGMERFYEVCLPAVEPKHTPTVHFTAKRLEVRLLGRLTAKLTVRACEHSGNFGHTARTSQSWRAI